MQKIFQVRNKAVNIVRSDIQRLPPRKGEKPVSYLFSPGVFWSGLIVNLCGCEVQALQMNS
jgi:hypothetical protein